MIISFQEKSTWISLLATSAVAAWFFSRSIPLVFAADLPNQEQLGAFTRLSVAAVVMLVLLQIVAHILLAIVSTAEDADERDALINMRSDQVGGIVLGVGVFSTIAHILAAGFVEQESIVALGSPFGILNMLVASLVVAELVACPVRVWMYRRG